MATYYVDPSGANGSGSEASPFNVLPANFSSAGYINGDVFLFKRGTTYTPTWAGVDGDAFVVNRQIKFSSYGSGDKPKIGSAFTGSGNGKMFRIYTSGCVFEHIEFRDTSGVHPVYVQNAIADFSVTACDFYNIVGDGVQFQNGLTIGAGGALTGTITVSGCTFDGICNDAISIVSSGRVVITNNTIRNVSVNAANGDCIAVSGDCTLIVTGNNCDKTSRDTKQCLIHDGGTGVGYAYIADNVFNGYFGSDSVNHTAVYVSLPGIITRNRIKSWRSGVFANVAGLRIANNVIEQGGGSANTGAVWGSFAGMVVENNTIIRLEGTELSDAAIRNNTSDAGNKYRNNVIVGFSRGIRKGALAVETNNVFWQVGTPVIDASAVTVAPHASDISGDPGLSDGYRPETGAAVLAVGAHLGYGQSMRDADGNQRPNPPSIGAYDVATLRRKLTADPAA